MVYGVCRRDCPRSCRAKRHYQKKAVQRWQWQNQYAHLTDFEKQVYAYLGEPVPPLPDCDDIGLAIIHIFYLASRSRRHIGGMATIPLPLTVQDISEVLAVYPVLASRELVDETVFAIDEIWLDGWGKDNL